MLERRLNRYPSKHHRMSRSALGLEILGSDPDLRLWGDPADQKQRSLGPVRAASLNAAAVSLP